jgi:hypothetical protein
MNEDESSNFLTQIFTIGKRKACRENVRKVRETSQDSSTSCFAPGSRDVSKFPLTKSLLRFSLAFSLTHTRASEGKLSLDIAECATKKRKKTKNEKGTTKTSCCISFESV